MGLTVDQAILQGIAAHNEGKLQEAERLYRLIIQSQSKHPDANHNLGVLAAGVGKFEEALSHFKIALEESPEQGQFWLSYIKALIELGEIDAARTLLNQGRDAGLKGDEVDKLQAEFDARLAAVPAIDENINLNQEQIGGVISLYTSGNLREALIQGKVLCNQFPNDSIIQNILGAINSDLDQPEEAISYYKKAIKLNPNFVEAHNNLGIALNQLGKYEEAIISYTTAIELKFDCKRALLLMI